MSLELLMDYHLSYLAVTVRLLTFLTFVPVIGGERVPPLLRGAIALVLAGVVFPTIVQHPVRVESAAQYAGLVAREFAIGALLGFLVELVFMAPRLLGRLVDVELGYGMAQLMDPQYGAVPVTGQLLHLSVVLTWFALNGHHELLRGIVGSFTAVPVGTPASLGVAAERLVEIFIRLFTAALVIGLPLLVPLFLATVMLGLLARAMPQLNLLIVGIPLKLLVGSGLLLVTLPVMLNGLVRLTEVMDNELLRLLVLLGY